MIGYSKACNLIETGKWILERLPPKALPRQPHRRRREHRGGVGGLQRGDPEAGPRTPCPASQN